MSEKEFTTSIEIHKHTQDHPKFSEQNAYRELALATIRELPYEYLESLFQFKKEAIDMEWDRYEVYLKIPS